MHTCVKWEYIFLEFDGTPSLTATSVQERIMDSLETKSIYIWLPDGSAKIIEIDGVIGYKIKMLELLNSLGNEGWEAFNLEVKDYIEIWTLKRKCDLNCF